MRFIPLFSKKGEGLEDTRTDSIIAVRRTYYIREKRNTV